MNKFKLISFGLLVLMVLILASATILEHFSGTLWVLQHIYHSVFFAIIWALMSIAAFIFLFNKQLIQRPISLLLHFSFVVILAGALVTRLSARQSKIHLCQGTTISTFKDQDGKTRTFPFEIIFDDFKLVTYPGTRTPQDYETHLTISDRYAHKTIQVQVAMNQIVSYKGYRFYQSGYDDDGKGSYLMVTHDPYGITLTYAGYSLLLLTIVLFFFDKKSNFRRLLSNPLIKKSFIMILLMACTSYSLIAQSKPKTLPAEQAQAFCSLKVLYNGRICPLQTLATDFTLKLYGKKTYRGFTAEQVFTGWLFYYSNWKHQPMIKIKSSAVRQQLGIKGKYAALDDFFDKQNNYKLAGLLAGCNSQNTVDVKELTQADEKFNLITMLYAGQLLTIFPNKNTDGSIEWVASNSPLPKDLDEQTWLFIRRSIDYANEMVQRKDQAGFINVVNKFEQYQKKVAQSILPGPGKIKAELIYNQLNYLQILAMFFLTIGFISLAYFIRRMIFQQKIHRMIYLALLGILILVFVYLTIIIGLRWYISNHFPAANGYETMLWLAWLSIVISLFFQHRFKLIIPFSYILAGFALLVSMLGQSNPPITHLMPVLNSPLLSIHVMVIMIAYALLAFIMLNGVSGIYLHFGGVKVKEPVERLQLISQVLLYPALFLLAVGIFVGAVWANISWGRYWGWDPKEVWALITLLIYTFPLHNRSIKHFQQPLFFHVYMVFAFFSVLFTYFGVNFLLGGMHSYAG